MYNRSSSYKPQVGGGVIQVSNEPASPGVNSYGKPFIIKLHKCGKG